MMKPYMISYDLDVPGQNYDEVIDTIKNFGGSYIKLQKSFWLVRTDLTLQEMNDKLLSVIDKNDDLFICKLEPNFQGNTTQENWDFIKENIFLN